MVHGDGLIRAEEVFHAVVRVSVCGDEIDGGMIRGRIYEETGDPCGGGRGRTPDSEASTDRLQGASRVFIADSGYCSEKNLEHLETGDQRGTRSMLISPPASRSMANTASRVRGDRYPSRRHGWSA